MSRKYHKTIPMIDGVNLRQVVLRNKLKERSILHRLLKFIQR